MKNASTDMILRSLRLPSIQREYANLAKTAEAESWGYETYLKALLDVEIHERNERRIERLLKRSELPDGKTLATLDEKLLPVKVRRQLPGLAEGGFVERSENILMFGLPGVGKSHVAAGLARELVMSRGYAVYFTPTHRLVERLLAAKRDLKIEAYLKKLDRFDVVVLDDIGYVQQSREEMEVLFTFLSERYERRSLMITSNLIFSEWDRIFKDPMTTAAAIDRLVHHSVILELDNTSIRAQQAKTRQGGGSLPRKGEPV